MSQPTSEKYVSCPCGGKYRLSVYQDKCPTCNLSEEDAIDLAKRGYMKGPIRVFYFFVSTLSIGVMISGLFIPLSGGSWWYVLLILIGFIGMIIGGMGRDEIKKSR